MGEDQHAACPCVITDTHTSMGGQLVGFPPYHSVVIDGIIKTEGRGRGRNGDFQNM